MFFLAPAKAQLDFSGAGNMFPAFASASKQF